MIEEEIRKRNETQQLCAVLVVLNSFENDSRVLKEALSLKKVGMSVSVCAMHEQGLLEREISDGLDIHRMKLSLRPLPKLKFIQLFKYLEFIIRSVIRFKAYDVIHCNDLSALPTGALIKLFNRNIRVLYDAHEYEIHRSSSQGPLSIKMHYFFEAFFIKYANAVTVTSQADAIEYAKLYNIPTPKIVMNCPVLSAPIKSGDLFRRKFNVPAEQIIYLYQGSLDRARGIQVMLDAFSKIDDGSSCIVFMGYGGMQSTIKSYASQYCSIHFHDAVHPDDLIRYTASADCGIIFMPNSCANHNFALPNKLFEYVMAEIPTIATPLQEISRVISKHNLGFIANGEDVQSLYDLVRITKREDLHALKGSLRIAREFYTWENQEKVFLATYHQILGL